MNIDGYRKYMTAEMLMGPNSLRILEELLAKFPVELSSDSMVLDLGCGTGRMTAELAARGYDMTGVDASAEMLAKAYERVSKTGQKGVLLLEQDMCGFELYGTVGAVVSTLDCINYLTEDGDLEACFATVHNYLDPDGLFFFDVNTPYKFEHIYGDNSYIFDEETSSGLIYCGWQNY